jgi:cyanate lyase
MRLSVLASLAFSGAVFAAPTVQAPEQEIHDVKFVLDGYAIIISNAHQLRDKIMSLKPGDDVISRLKEMSVLSGTTIKVTEKMTKDINALKGKLSLEAVLKVAEPSVEVASTAATIIDGLVAKKQLFVKAGVHKIVKDDLDHLYKVCIAFAYAAKAKIPDLLVSAANDAFQRTIDSLATGVKNFASTN